MISLLLIFQQGQGVQILHCWLYELTHDVIIQMLDMFIFLRSLNTGLEYLT